MPLKLSEKSFIRARRPDQIEERRQAILVAAYDLFAENGLENVSLRDIATRADTAKSNIYRYFESREHIYLDILQQEGVPFEEHAISSLKKLAGRGSIADVASALTNTFSKFEKYSLLMSVINSVLEKDLSAELVASYRSIFLERRNRIAAAMADALPEATSELISPLMFAIFAYVSGSWALSHPSKECQRLFKKPEYSHLRLVFEEETSRFIALLLQGALSTPNANTPITPTL